MMRGDTADTSSPSVACRPQHGEIFHSALHTAFTMTEKPYKQQTVPTDPRLRAGVVAERQMAHYLHRRFHDDPGTHILHGLRLEDREQPEQDGSPGVCQIDHRSNL